MGPHSFVGPKAGMIGGGRPLGGRGPEVVRVNRRVRSVRESMFVYFNGKLLADESRCGLSGMKRWPDGKRSIK